MSTTQKESKVLTQLTDAAHQLLAKCNKVSEEQVKQLKRIELKVLELKSRCEEFESLKI